MKRFWLLLLLIVLFLSACVEPIHVAQITETIKPSETITLTVTPEPTDTATITPTKTITLTSTPEPIILPDWVRESSSDLYLCIAPDEAGEMHLAIVNPLSQEFFLLPFREKDMKGYFWATEPKQGIGWINRRFDEYSILDISTGTIENYPISQDSKIFVTHSFSVVNEPSDFRNHAYPVKMIVLNDGEVFFSRQDVNHTGQDFSKNLSLDERLYIFEVRLIEHHLGNYTKINGYDIQKQQEISYDIQEIHVRQAIVNWLPNSDALVEIGDYIVDMSDGLIVQEIPESDQRRAWNSNGKEFYFNPISIWDFYSSDKAAGTEIFVYNVDFQTTEKLEAIDVYFKHHDTFSLAKEFLDNLTYIPSLDALGFSYYGLGTAGGYEMDTAGGYCLYSFVTSEVNCVTDAIDEMLIVIDESVNYTAREQVVYAQWSNSERFIAFFIRLYDDEHPRILMYDLETGYYFFINNHYIDGPLGIWSP